MSNIVALIIIVVVVVVAAAAVAINIVVLNNYIKIKMFNELNVNIFTCNRCCNCFDIFY